VHVRSDIVLLNYHMLYSATTSKLISPALLAWLFHLHSTVCLLGLKPSSVMIVGHCHVRCSTNQHSSRRSGIPSCWTTVVEQPSVQSTTVRPYLSSVPPGVKDVFVWLIKTPAPNDFCF